MLTFIKATLAILLLFSPEACTTRRHATVLSKKEVHHIFNIIRTELPFNGTLTESPDGFVYVKVDDGYINQLAPLVANHGYKKPPYFRRKDSPGAHISVFYVGETRKLKHIEEIGKVFHFEPVKLAFVPQKNQKYLVLQVKSPSLEKLRKKYGLTPLLKDHFFHITIAEKRE